MSVTVEKTLIGWGAVRESPWHFGGLFGSQGEAQVKATELGSDYIVRYGERQADADTFGSPVPTPGTLMRGSIFEPGSDDEAQSSRLAGVAAWIDEQVVGAIGHD